MSEVRLSIGGRDYTVSCADGQEAHVARLGEAIDGKFHQLGNSISNKDAQNMLFAALLLADELHEQRTGASTPAEPTSPGPDEEVARLRTALQDAEIAESAARSEIETLRADLETVRAGETALRTELENLKGEQEAAMGEASGNGERAATPSPGLFGDPELAPALERFADLLENCADKLESKLATS